jgi:prepilin-type processing-associated H-X9-DG protein
MKTTFSSESALSLTEILVTMATVALLMAFLLPALFSRSGPVMKSRRISCVGHLKQIGMSFRIYANDHEGGFPPMVSVHFDAKATGGSREFAGSAQVFRHFQAASNELNSPVILACPSDEARRATRDFAILRNTNLSYFVGLDAIETDPQMILSGDRNVTGGTKASPNLLFVRTNHTLGWTKELHDLRGNVGLADGSVQQVNVPQLNQQMAAVTNAVVRLAIP